MYPYSSGELAKLPLVETVNVLATFCRVTRESAGDARAARPNANFILKSEPKDTERRRTPQDTFIPHGWRQERAGQR